MITLLVYYVVLAYIVNFILLKYFVLPSFKKWGSIRPSKGNIIVVTLLSPVSLFVVVLPAFFIHQLDNIHDFLYKE